MLKVVLFLSSRINKVATSNKSVIIIIIIIPAAKKPQRTHEDRRKTPWRVDSYPVEDRQTVDLGCHGASTLADSIGRCSGINDSNQKACKIHQSEALTPFQPPEFEKKRDISRLGNTIATVTGDCLETRFLL